MSCSYISLINNSTGPSRVIQSTSKECDENTDITASNLSTDSTVQASDSKLVYNVVWGNLIVQPFKFFHEIVFIFNQVNAAPRNIKLSKGMEL